MAQDQLNQGARSDPGEPSGQGVPRLRAAKIMERVRVEMALHRIARHATTVEVGVRAEVSRPLPRWQPAEPRFEPKPAYKLAELLRFDDADFIETAYRILLGRTPDSSGRDSYLPMLRNGHAGKVEILGSIRFSEEGRKCGVHVDGLLLPYKLHQWRHKRIVGSLVGFAMAVFRLPHLTSHLQAMEARSARESQELGNLLNRCEAVIDQHFANVDQRFADVAGAIHDLGAKLTRSDSLWIDVARAVESRIESLDQSLLSQEQYRDKLVAQLHQHESLVANLKSELLAATQALARSDEAWREGHTVQDQRLQDVAARLGVHDAAISGLHTQADRDQRSLQALLDRLTVFFGEAARSRQDKSGEERQGPSPLETQYASFEDAFRGGRAEIKKRVAHYLGTLKNAGIGSGDGLVLDLGSGRGEWLEVLTEQGYACRGVDLSRGMLEESRKRGYDVVETDALGYLRILDDGSVAAITSIHLVEHLPHPVLIDLLDESLRVLRPGGVLILETPNPENVRVGSCQFYMDPTHLHPIPPLLLQWVVRSRGFADPAIERLSEHRGTPDLVPVSADVPGAGQINQMIEWFTGPPDYAVIARKPGAA